MFGLAVIELVSGPRILGADFWLRVGTAVLALALIPFDLAPLTVVVVLATALVLQVVYELARHEAHTKGAEI
jgi:hypothetical protein